MRLSLLCEGLINEAGYARTITFNYDVRGEHGPNKDKRPTVLILGKWKNPRTGKTLLGGINLNYLDRYERDVILSRDDDDMKREERIMELKDLLKSCKGRQCTKIKKELAELEDKHKERNSLQSNLRKILSPDKSLYNRYWRARRHIPTIINKAYRTYDWNMISGMGDVDRGAMPYKSKDTDVVDPADKEIVAKHKADVSAAKKIDKMAKAAADAIRSAGKTKEVIKALKKK